MPRRYRPPSGRRKSKKRRLPQDSAAPAYEGAVVHASSPSPARAAPAAAAPRERPSETQHIARDHSYVLADLRRVGLIVAFITIGLVITAILR